MKLSNDQKKIIRALAIYLVCCPSVTILYQLIKGNIVWMDILLQTIMITVISILLTIFFVIGSKTPEK